MYVLARSAKYTHSFGLGSVVVSVESETPEIRLKF